MSKAMEEQDMDRGVRSRHQTASDFLFDLWRTGRVADGLPRGVMPTSRGEAYAVQHHCAAALRCSKPSTRNHHLAPYRSRRR